MTPITHPNERLDWLRLIRTQNVGPMTFYRLMEQFQTASAALEAIPQLAQNGGGKKTFKMCPKQKAQDELSALEDLGGQMILRDDPEYPPLLRHVEDAPPVISARGHVHLLKKKAIAIVGGRNASINGRNLAAEFGAELGQAGLLVVSGLARGIDGAAHASALESGTVGVQGGGVDVIYPKENTALYEQMCLRGCVIAEPALKTQPQARHFPRRNRIISGMVRGVLVIEASPKSGSLITARLALEQGRDVFAVPGSPLDKRSNGGNHLIRQGAVLVEKAQDLIEELNRQTKPILEEGAYNFNQKKEVTPIHQSEIDKYRNLIKESLSFSPVCVDEIIRECQICPSVVQQILLELELAGKLERSFGNKVSLIS